MANSKLDVACLSDEEVTAIDRFAFERDRRRYTATRNFVRHLLSKYATREPAEWRFVTNDYGKPSIHPDLSADIYFNISHTKSRVVCAVALFPDIGVDIEDKIPKDFRKLANKFFSNGECDWLMNLQAEHDARAGFLSLWTLKEAFIKAVGKGMYIPLTSFCVLPKDPDRAELTQLDTEVGSWDFRRFVLDDSRVAVAFPSTADEVRCELFEFAFD